MNGPQTDLDHAAFERVWRRVMPQDRADCPFTLDAPAEDQPQAEQAIAPAASVPVQESAPQATPPAPVGAMTSLAVQTMAPISAPTPLPAAPATMPMAAPRQAVSGPGIFPSPCLGEGAAGELPTLEALLVMVREGRQVYKGLTRSARARTAQSGLLSDLIAAKDQQLRRLRTAHFLISGNQPDLAPTTPRRWPSLALALRDRYHSEQDFALRCLAAAGSSADPCLIDLYRSLASQSQELAGSLREALESL